MGFNHTVLEREMKGSGESPFALFKRNQSGLRKRISMVGSALLSQFWVLMFFLLLVLWNITKMSTNPHSTIAPGTQLFPSLLGESNFDTFSSFFSEGTFFLLGFFWLTIGFPVVILGRLVGSMVCILLLFCRIYFESLVKKLKCYSFLLATANCG